MHYANGKEAKAGDLIIHEAKYSEKSGHQSIGVLTSATAGSTACNGNVAVFAKRDRSDLGWGPWVPVSQNGNSWSVTLSECLPVESDELRFGVPTLSTSNAATVAV